MKALVTGGGGFLASGIIKRLFKLNIEIVSLSRNYYPDLEIFKVSQKKGNLNNYIDVLSAAKGCHIIFHVASKTGVWGKYKDYYNTNVIGTKNVIAACEKLNIKYLIYTSSPSVIFHGADMEGANESVPYPEKYHSHYPKTKAIAEKIVLKANSNKISTVVLRPHLIWGPGDNQLTPRIIERGKAGKLRRIGNRKNLIDSVYIDNAVQAHILAATKIMNNAPIGGKAYFISQGEPLPLWDLINKILKAGGIPPVTKSISPTVAYILAGLMETIYTIFAIKKEPLLTRFVVNELSTAHWFDISAAKKDLGYTPKITIDEGLIELKKWLGSGHK